MELVKLFEDYSYSVKSPELAAGSWRNMVTEPDPGDEKKRDKRSYCSSSLPRGCSLMLFTVPRRLGDDA